MGPTRMLFSKPVIAAVEGHAVAGGLGTLAGATSGLQPLILYSVSSAAAGASLWLTEGQPVFPVLPDTDGPWA